MAVEGTSTSRRSARSSRRRAPTAAISAWALRPSRSAPATAARPSPRAAWRSRPAGRTSHAHRRSVRLCRGAHRRLAARTGLAHHAGADHRRRNRRAAATSSRSFTAIPTAAPYGWGTFASRSLVISGGATRSRRRTVRAKLIKIASHMLEADAARHRAGRRQGQGRRHRPLRHRSRRWRAKPTRRRTASRARSSPA